MTELEEKREAVKVATERKLEAIFEGIKAELLRRGLTFEGGVQTGGRYGFSSVDGQRLNVTLKEEHGKNQYRMWNPQVSKIRIVVGDYSDKRQFPERKDGFDYAAIVDDIVARLQRAKAAEVSNAAHMRLRAQLDVQVKRIKSIVGEIRSARIHVVDSSGIHVEADGLTEEQALQVMQLLQSFKART